MEENSTSTTAPSNSHPNTFRFGPIQPRLGEFDLGGVLYHARYFHLLEDAREAFLRSIGNPYEDLVRQHQHLAIVESHQAFHAPVVYGQLLFIHLTLRELSRVKILLQYEIFDDAGRLLHTASTTHVFVEAKAGKMAVAKLPEVLRNKLNALLKT